MTHCNENLQVKKSGPKGTQGDTLQLPHEVFCFVLFCFVLSKDVVRAEV